MAIINDLTVFTTVSGGGGASARTNFRADDDFSTDGYTDDIAVSASLPQNIGIAFVNSSESPADYATISLRGDDTSTVYINNTAGSVDFVVSRNSYVGYSMDTNFGLIEKPTISYNSSYSGYQADFQDYNKGNLYAAGGIYASGVVYGGNLSGTTKYFNIEHPTQPGKRLVHACLEGPENGVYVRGRLTGSNVIELPEYWTGLVDPETITVNVTQIGYSQDLIVDKIEWGRKVIIKSGNGTTIDCYYTVNGTRKDVPPLSVEFDS